jgi:arylsulfatase A-like enzyme
MQPFVSASRNGRYGAAVAAVDWSTGVLMAEIKRLGIDDNTLIIFTSKDSKPDKLELFDLSADPGETRDLAAAHPEVLDRLVKAMMDVRAELGDSRLGIEGGARRPPAVTRDPKPLTTFDPEHPYIEPFSQLDEAG